MNREKVLYRVKDIFDSILHEGDSGSREKKAFGLRGMTLVSLLYDRETGEIISQREIDLTANEFSMVKGYDGGTALDRAALEGFFGREHELDVRYGSAGDIRIRDVIGRVPHAFQIKRRGT